MVICNKILFKKLAWPSPSNSSSAQTDVVPKGAILYREGGGARAQGKKEGGGPDRLVSDARHSELSLRQMAMELLR